MTNQDDLHLNGNLCHVDSHVEVRVSEDGMFEIWWDRPVETANKLDHNRPDVVLIDRRKKHWTIIDFSVPNDKNVVTKEEEKIDKYTKLGYEIRKLHKVSTNLVPLVVGALGTVSKKSTPPSEISGYATRARQHANICSAGNIHHSKKSALKVNNL